MINSLRYIHQHSDGISPYLRCPWCGYRDVIGEFLEYHHPEEPIVRGTGSTQCGQCWAAGPTPIFVLAYDPKARLYESEEFRDLYIQFIMDTPEGLPDDPDPSGVLDDEETNGA